MTTIPSGTWTIDETHSEIGFSIKHLMISKVKGKFDSFSGEIITGATTNDVKITGTINVASVNTNHTRRDEHLRTGEFFDTAQYPTIIFTSTKLVHIKDDKWLLEGNLTLHGITKSITLEVEFGGVVIDLYDQTKIAASATGTINRSDFDLTYNAPLEAGGMLLGETVNLHLEVQAILNK